MDRHKRLSEEKIGKLLWSFAIPSISSMVVNALYGVVDRIFVGRGVGSLAIAGVMVGMPVMLILMAFGMLVGFGAANSISIYLGQHKREEAENTAGNAIFLFLTGSAAITVLGLIFIRPLLVAFGSSPEVMPYAEQFLRVILIGTVFQGLGFGMSNVIRAEGNPLYSMITQMTGAVLNAVLCYVFIFIFRMGVAGSAAATVTAQAVSTALVLGYFYTKKSHLHLHMHNLIPRWPIIRRMLSIGLAPFSMQMAMSVLMVILNTQLVKNGGDTALSAWGAINSVMMLIMMPVFGLNQGAQPIIGFNFGARNCDRVRKTFLLAALNATLIVVFGFVLVQVFAPQMIAAFTQNDVELVRVGTRGLRIFLFMLPLVGFQVVGSGYFQFIGKPAPSMLLGLSRQVLILIPAVLILPVFFGLDGVWMAGPTADILSSLVTGFFVIAEMRKLTSLDRCGEQPETVR